MLLVIRICCGGRGGNHKWSEIHWQLCAVYRKEKMSEVIRVRQWCIGLKNDCADDVHDDDVVVGLV